MINSDLHEGEIQVQGPARNGLSTDGGQIVAAQGSRTVTFAVCDEQPLFREGIKRWLSFSTRFRFTCVSDCESPEEFLAKGIGSQADVLLLGLKFFGRSQGALDVIRQIGNEDVPPRVIVALEYHGTMYEKVLKHYGVGGTIDKILPPSVMVGVIEAVAAGRTLFLTAGSIGTPRLGVGGSPKTELSPQERQTLVLVTEGLTNQQIAFEMKISLGSVRQYLANAFSKLDSKTRAEAVVKALTTQQIDLDLRQR